MKTLVTAVTAVLVLGATLPGAHAQGSPQVISTPAEAHWGPAPPLVPPGAQIAVLAGDPGKAAALYTVRLKFPANYAIPAHSHPTDEHVVVVSGALTLGMGDKIDKKAPGNKTLTTGGFALMPAGMNHFAYAGKNGATIVLYGQGPLDFKYVNPADDPRNAPKAAH